MSDKSSARSVVVTFLFSLALSSLLASTNAAAQTFSLAPGSPTVPGPKPGCPPFTPGGDIASGPPVFAFPLAVAPMGPPGCGLGWPFPLFGADNVDAFSSGLSIVPPPPIPPASVSIFFSVDPGATGSSAPCAAPPPAGFFAPDVASEACAQPATSDAAADVFVTAAPNPPLPSFGIAGNTQLFDGNGLPAAPSPCGVFPPGPPLGLAEPVPGGDDLDAFDVVPFLAWDPVPPGGDGIPDLPVYYSVDMATAVLGSGGAFAQADVLVTVGGGPPAVYAPAPALGLDIIGGPFTDDLDALIVLDGDGLPFGYVPGVDIVYFSVAPGSAIVGAPDPCPASPFLGVGIGTGDILSEGTLMGAPGAACIVAKAPTLLLWDFFFCGPNPVTGAFADDNLDALDAAPPTTTTTTTFTTTTSTTITTTTSTMPPTTTTTVSTTTTSTTTSTTTTTLTALCGPAPELDGSCNLAASPGKSSVQIKDLAPAKDQLKWKWNKGVATVVGDFKSPDTGTATYRLCIYDTSINPQPLLEADIPPGGVVPLCGTKPCWKPSGTTGFKYKNKAATPDGITGAKFKAGAAGKSQVGVQGKGALLGPPGTAALATPIVVQLLIDDGGPIECFKTTFSTVSAQSGTLFKAKGP